MPRGLLSGLVQEVANQFLGTAASFHEGHDALPIAGLETVPRSCRGIAAARFLHTTHSRITTAFEEDEPDKADSEEAQENAAAALQDVAKQANAELEGGKPKAPKKAKKADWENTDGLPDVSLISAADSYVSRDIADSPGESVFRPTLGCKCEDWRPAPSHPQIEFREPFLAAHPDFTNLVQKIKVHMEDDTDKAKPVVHWDAIYDLKKYADPLLAAEGKVKLEETTPAEPGSGTQLRFLTFCPPEHIKSGAAGIAHTYELKVTALDATDQPIEYFNDRSSTYQAQPAPPENMPAPGPSPGAKAEMKRAEGKLQVAQAEIRKGESALAEVKKNPALA